MRPTQLLKPTLILIAAAMLSAACTPGKRQEGLPANSGGAQPPQSSTVINSADGLTQITLPPNWKQEQELHEQAEVQASDRASEMYVIVMSENKEDFRDMTVERHSQFTRSALMEKLTSPEVSGPKQVAINGLPGVQYEIRGGIDDINIVYLHTTVESPARYHQILAWTLKSRFEKNRPELEQVIGSFREAGGPR